MKNTPNKYLKGQLIIPFYMTEKNEQTYTKIISTIGPASDSQNTIREMYNSGMRIARLNFSHGDHNYFLEVIKKIRNVSEDIAILADTKGPEIRTGEVENKEITLEKDETITLTNEKKIGNKNTLTINYPHLENLQEGDKVLIDDGLIETQIIGKDKEGQIAKIKNTGKLGSNKTVSIKGHKIKIDYLSQKDKEDIQFAANQNLDFIAASFIRGKEDIDSLKQYLKEINSTTKIISKIENEYAIENIDEIINSSEGIMIARGDLGVEINMEEIPELQKKLVKKSNQAGKPAIVATQMLESMKENPRPTRAEISDVAQAILDGADAIMLSAETASGKYPIKAVETMKNVAKIYDKKVSSISSFAPYKNKHNNCSTSLFITQAVAQACDDLNISAIIAPTHSGFTPRKISRFKPKVPIIAIPKNNNKLRELQLSWGVFPILIDEKQHIEIIKELHEREILNKDNTVAITSNHSTYSAGHTNTIEIFNVESIISGETKNLPEEY